MVRGLEYRFFNNLDELNVRRPDAILRVTEHIDDIIEYIKQLVELECAYISSTGVYFSVASTFKEYNKFGMGLINALDTIDDCDSSVIGDNDTSGKKNVRDFALWKFINKDDTTPSWDSPWGRGRPGWHIGIGYEYLYYFVCTGRVFCNDS